MMAELRGSSSLLVPVGLCVACCVGLVACAGVETDATGTAGAAAAAGGGGAPSAPPQNITCVALNSSSLLVSWEPPPAHGQQDGGGGGVTGYMVAYRELPSQGVAHAADADDGSGDGDDDDDDEEEEGDDEEEGDHQGEHQGDHHQGDEEGDGTGGRPSRGGGWRRTPRQPAYRRSVTLHGLTRWAPYEVTVRAYTGAGPGPSSPPVQARTRDDATTTTTTSRSSPPSSGVSTGDKATLPSSGSSSASISFLSVITVLAILPFLMCTVWGRGSAGKRPADERGGNAPSLVPEKDTVSDCSHSPSGRHTTRGDATQRSVRTRSRASGYGSNVLAGDGGDGSDTVEMM
ncbi:uncharacterized protein LOC142919875 isoform X2 [Petromyzon marinus]|uniref:uncharacterized protein LOC142919875 isoform X2 n=1 Tax=Petromyzon marinus TaxID=7757 RepID=UPI003F6FD771